jgi:hypothetical protein
MTLKDLFPDDDDRAAFVRAFTMASAKAMHDLREENASFTEAQVADELESRIRREIGTVWPLPRHQLLQLARDVLADRGA